MSGTTQTAIANLEKAVLSKKIGRPKGSLAISTMKKIRSREAFIREVEKKTLSLLACLPLEACTRKLTL